MADPIIQELGFDVKRALSDLDKLDKRLATLNDSFGSLTKGLDSFNASGGKASLTFQKMGREADKASKKITDLVRSQKRSGSRRGGPPNFESDDIADSLRDRFKLPAGASLTQSRAFESAIRKAADAAAAAGKDIDDVERIMRGLGDAFDSTENKIADSVAKIEKSFQSISNAAEKNSQRAQKELDKLVKEANKDEIAQGLRRQFNVPADATVQELRQFENAIEKAAASAAKAGKTVKDVPGIFKNLGKDFKGVDNDIANSLNNVQKSYKRLGQTARKETEKLANNTIKNVQRITVSFDTFVRIISTQLIIKALNKIQNAFSDAARASIQFEKSIARIKTIGPELGDLDQISKQIRGISDAFGLDLQSVSEAAFERISNQVGTANQSISRLAEVAKFAAATGTELADGVGLADSVINATGKTIEDTGEILSKFFKVIDLGRVEADQLRNTLGRVLPVGTKLGVTYEEIGAALAEITVQGVNTNEAFTQIRGILNALQKPTDAMKEALQELGFSEAEAAVRTLGLGKLLAELEKTTEGSANAFSKLFPNIRGITGATILANNEAEGFRTTLDKLNDTTDEFLDEKFQIVFETNAARVEREVNKLSNAVKVDLGKAVTSATSALFGLIGADRIITVVTNLTPAIVGLGAAMSVIATRAGAAQLGLVKLTDELGNTTKAAAAFSKVSKGIALATVAATLGNQLGNLIGDAIFKGATDGLDKLQADAKKRLEQIREDFTRSGDAAEIILGSSRRGLREFTKENRDSIKEIEVDSERAIAGLGQTLKGVVSQRKRLVEELKRASVDSANAVIASQNRVEAALQRQQDRRLSQRLAGLSPEFQILELRKETRRLTSEAGSQLTQALRSGSERDLQRALSLFDRAEQSAERLQDVAGSTGNFVQQRRAAETLDRLTSKRLSAERRIQDAKLEQSREAEASSKLIDEENKNLERQVALIQRNIKAFKESEDSAQRSELLSQISQGLSDLPGLSDKALGLLSQLGVEDFLTDAQDQLAQNPLQVQFEVDTNALKRVEKQLRDQLQDLRIQIGGDSLFFLQRGTGLPVRDTKSVETAINRLTTELQKDIEASRAVAEGGQEIDRIIRRINITGERGFETGDDELRRLATRELGGVSQKILDVITPSNRQEVNEAAEGLLNFRDKLDSAVERGDFTAKTLNEIATAGQTAKEAMEAIGPVARALIFTANDEKSIGAQVQDFRELVGQQQNLEKSGRRLQTPAARARQEFLQQTDLDEESRKALQNLGAGGAALNSGSKSMLSNSRQTRLQLEAGARALSQVGQQGSPTGGSQGRFFASGGFPRGTDTIPAALSPGEGVINPKSTRSFFSQLQAINAGQQPVFRESGSVTNVGDINVNVNSSEQPANPREIAQAVRRELRRGTSKLR